MRIVPATAELLREYYGETPRLTLRAYVILDGEKPVAVGGFIRIAHNYMAVFSESKEDEREKHKVTAVKFAKMLMHIADENRWKLFADPDCDIGTAKRFLERLGFRLNDAGEYVR